jgi:glucose/mannose-6-phosphate isomerase
MQKLIEDFPLQLREAIGIADKQNFPVFTNPISNVIIAGLGGSGISGSIVSNMLENELTIPVTVVNRYFLPGYAGVNSLVIASSYSGNTEETISCLQEAIQKECNIICISSGGKIEEIAKEFDLFFIKIPGGNPPRASIGYSLVQLLAIFKYYSIAKLEYTEQLQAAIALIENEKNAITIEAKAVAAKMLNKTPVIYSSASTEAIIKRFRQQINENAKTLCWHHVFPEMNHNELVGWREKNENLAVIIFRNESDYERNKKRIEFSKNVFQKYTSTLIEIFSKGNSNIENTIYFIHIGDWISLFLAEMRGVNSVEVEVIDHLKSELSSE